MQISIRDGAFLFDGKLTYSTIPGARPEAFGRLMNTRMAQATFFDENPETNGAFTYPDGTPYDPDRQTNEFVAALPEYRRHGVIAVGVNLQGGCPYPHTALTPELTTLLKKMENSAFTSAGALKWAHSRRLERIVAAADALGMVVIVGLFYFGQNSRLRDEAAVRRAIAELTEFILGLGHGNVLIEVNNECDIVRFGTAYVHPILQPAHVHESIQFAKKVSKGRLLVTTSYVGGSIPSDAVIDASDYILLHGNRQDADGIRKMVATTRAKTSKPIVFNEDSTKMENSKAAWDVGTSWGYYDQGSNNYHDGFQCPPASWAIDTANKKAFFDTVARLVGVASV